ncbi:Gfo/Idh/MocA family oxidoreductase [Cnuibacter physcomitrellae]|uniref:Gfo/Idh/MocA family protein n=1 Tax=Cnuibacter physcomitrellae TaxID=1619308 RepID=UPI002175805B|nr:Gfo/Idh/MocA family oxidoreductase [Cnuibacter physcomitrellae]MCS5497986.1 Gfo/Idh/MocA family oxidoreductase [Cnuibacter physcomitrellae]
MRRRIRSAIIGTGMIAAVHARAVHAARGEVAGFLGSRPGRAATIAAEWDAPEFAELDALLTSDVDVVHVCTPNGTHVEYAEAALQAGKHVVCEKPLATSPDDARRLASVAESSGLVATVPFVYRFHPLVRELRARRIAGEFGAWNALHGSYTQDWLLSPDAGNWRVDDAAGGASRAFADIGSHWCDLVEFVSGETLAEVSALLSIAVPDRPAASAEAFSVAEVSASRAAVRTEDVAVATFLTASGLPVNVIVSQVAAGRRNRLWFELDGSSASAVFDQEQPETAWIGTAAGARTIARGTSPMSVDQARLSYVPAGHAQGYQDCFDAFIADTFAAVRGDVHDGLPTFSDGARSAGIVDAVVRSARSRSWTEIEGARA